MEDIQKTIFTVRVTYKADITLTIEADDADDALRQASEKAQAADNSEFNIYDEQDIDIVNVWNPEGHTERQTNLPRPIDMALAGL